MDHRISKDMISSGMIPSGEKKQEDLGKNQYGTAPSPNALSDVYKKMYETKEEVINEHHKKDADGNTIPHEGDEINEAPMLATAALGLVKKIATKQAFKKLAGNVVTGAAMSAGSNLMSGGGGGGGQQKTKTGTVSNSADLFDIVKGQLLDEGLSEEEIRDIMLTLTPDEIMSEMAVNPNIAAMDAKNKADMIARAQANKVPDKVKEASKRQMKAGTPREDSKNPYTTQDKKTIIDYNKDK